MRPLRGLQETRVATREESGVLGFPSRRGLTPRGQSWIPTGRTGKPKEASCMPHNAVATGINTEAVLGSGQNPPPSKSHTSNAQQLTTKWKKFGFPCGSAGKESDVGELGLIPGLGRSPGEGKRLPTPDSMGMSLSKLKRDMGKDREAWCAAVRGVTKSQTRQHSESARTSLVKADSCCC